MGVVGSTTTGESPVPVDSETTLVAEVTAIVEVEPWSEVIVAIEEPVAVTDAAETTELETAVIGLAPELAVGLEPRVPALDVDVDEDEIAGIVVAAATVRDAELEVELGRAVVVVRGRVPQEKKKPNGSNQQFCRLSNSVRPLALADSSSLPARGIAAALTVAKKATSGKSEATCISELGRV